MDIQAEKLNLIQWLAGIDNEAIIQQFAALRKQQESDWWDEISEEERAEIEEGLAQANHGELIPHDQVMAKYKQWL